ncbi:MAG: c-type cytochrome domain-containing protein [Edaphobacter sp.]
MRRLAAILGTISIVLLGWGCRREPVKREPPRTDFYTTKVQPIFRANCYRCHGTWNRRGGLNLSTRAGILKGGHTGPAVIPGDPAKSLLMILIRHEGHGKDQQPMPPKSPKLSAADIATVEQWVKAGAIIPEDPATSWGWW